VYLFTTLPTALKMPSMKCLWKRINLFKEIYKNPLPINHKHGYNGKTGLKPANTILDSSVVEQSAVNRSVASSNLARGVLKVTIDI
jgi:hypothetical protein